MKYALIGCGRISPNHIEAAKNNNLEFVAMCDVLPEVMAEKSEKFGLERVKKYTDYKELLNAEKPELVAIATESGKHASIALDCIKAGCNVIIEKPIALSIAPPAKSSIPFFHQLMQFSSPAQSLYREDRLPLRENACPRIQQASSTRQIRSTTCGFPAFGPHEQLSLTLGAFPFPV